MTRADRTVQGVLFTAALALVACFLVSIAGAGDQPTGAGASAQPEMKKDQSQAQQDVKVPGELGKDQERLLDDVFDPGAS